MMNSNTVNVCWLKNDQGKPIRGIWDEGLLEHLLSGRLISPSLQYLQFKVCEEVPKGEPCVIVICGSYFAPRVDDLRKQLEGRGPAIICHMADEGHLLDSSALLRPGDVWWRQIENPDALGATNFPARPHRAMVSGWRNETIELLRAIHATKIEHQGPGPKDLLWAYSGQINHSYRAACYEELNRRRDGKMVCSHGFGQGLPYPEYLALLARAKIAICPSGPVTADTMRMYEALEAGCLPICNRRAPGQKGNYWLHVFGQEPFPCVDDWHKELPKLLDYFAGDPYALKLKTAQALQWWADYKLSLVKGIEEDWAKVCAVK